LELDSKRVRYLIKILDAAERELAEIPLKNRLRISRRIDALALNPRPPGAVKLKGEFPDHYRIRIGFYRVIYKIEKKNLIIVVVRVGHRREVYRKG